MRSASPRRGGTGRGAEVGDEALEQAAELFEVGGRPVVEHVVHVVVADRGHAAFDGAAPIRERHDGDPAVARGARPLDQAVVLELADLAAGRRRVHVREAGELAEGERALLLEEAQQRVAGLGDDDARGRGLHRVDLAARAQPEQGRERLLDDVDRRFARRLEGLCTHWLDHGSTW